MLCNLLTDKSLEEAQEAAKAAEKGIWAPDASEHVREITWDTSMERDSLRQLVDRMQGKPVSAIIENVRDGSTVRAFLLPDYYHVTLMMSGVKVSSAKQWVSPFFGSRTFKYAQTLSLQPITNQSNFIPTGA